VCWHPQRGGIERETFDAIAKTTRVKGFDLIANKYGISSISLRRHCGRVGSVPRSGETQRSHFSIGPTAPIVHCPRKFFGALRQLSGTELMIYSLLLLEWDRERIPGLSISVGLIEQRLGFRLDDSQLSFVLNHLGSTGAGLIDFRKRPNDFHVNLARPLTKSTFLVA
jgi:hypothetical protein